MTRDEIRAIVESQQKPAETMAATRDVAAAKGGTPADSLQKTGEAGDTRGDNGRFRKGQSGNPDGRQKGSRNKATRIAQLLLEGEAEALARKAIERALAGDALALKLCLDRILAPQRRRPVEVALPELREAADLAGAMNAVSAAVAAGEITPAEASELALVVDTAIRAYNTSENERLRRHLWSAQRPAPKS
jgi:hypothetical protein